MLRLWTHGCILTSSRSASPVFGVSLMSSSPGGGTCRSERSRGALSTPSIGLARSCVCEFRVARSGRRPSRRRCGGYPSSRRACLSNRGGPLSAFDESVRASIPGLAADGIDIVAVTAAWEHALAVPSWSGSLVWMHGDLMPTNLLVRGDGGLAGVLDFGCCTTGDPACESLLAWMTLTSSARARYRGLVGLDEAAWARARGWALAFAVLAAPYYRRTFPLFAGVARRAIAEVLVENLE